MSNPYDPQQGHNQPPPPGYYPTGFSPGRPYDTVNPEKNGFGLAAVILGPIGLFFCIMPITGWLGVILGFVGLIFGIAGLARVSKGKATNKKTAVTGLVFSLLAIVAGIAATVVFFSIVNDFGNDMDCISRANTSAEINACH